MRKGIANYKIGDTYEGFMLIKSATRGTASNGKAFLTIYFTDSTGEIEAKLWDASKDDMETFVEEKVVHIVGDINEFRGKAQLRIKTIRPAQVTDGVRVSDFLQKAPVDKEVLQEKITEAIFEMQNPNLQRIVRAFVQKYQEELYVYPAASKIHHAYVSGLAHHIVGMLQVAKQLCDLYPTLNKDLLYAGVILHDIGKIHELSGAVSTSYTLEGNLLGHISMMATEVKEVADQLGIEGEEVIVSQHLILSDHGQLEYGSPKRPIIQEVEILHLIDVIDAQMNVLTRELGKTLPGEFTERIFSLDNRSFYKPKFTNE